MEVGRWHDLGQHVIYASSTYSTALLEKLAHFYGELPSNQHFVRIEIGVGTSYEVVTKDSLPGWIDEDVARSFGRRWIIERRSAVLIVPSFVAREDTNVLISNPAHPQFVAVRPALEQPVMWDVRLFRQVV